LTPIAFDNSYIRLPERFYSREEPTPVASPALIRVNPELAQQLGIDLDWLASDEAVQVFAGNRILPESQPIATVYAGHQFGGWNPQLGDGRAILLGEVVDVSGRRYDIQLKGSGPTPWSRGGDGRSPLGPVLREYIVSEAMAALGIPTTRSLAAVTSGEPVYRNDVLPGAILTRVARSHIRVGHFQYFLGKNDMEGMRLLADHLIERDFPAARQADNPYAALLELAVSRQASLIAHWQLVGFIHGVMNTDNMLICGETIDYGPCAFMDGYDPDACFSSIDHGKRYAYRNQPVIAQWNLSWFAQCLLPLFCEDQTSEQQQKQAVETAQAILDNFNQQYEDAYQTGMHRKLGLGAVSEASVQLVESLLAAMATHQLDYTLTFRHLADLADPHHSGAAQVSFQLPEAFDPLVRQWCELLSEDDRSDQSRQQEMYAVNPTFIPRNHLVDQAIRAAEQEGDLVPFQRLVDRLAQPFEYSSDDEDLARPPQLHEVVKHTFCGT